jgi:hypothetical protein
MNRRGFLAAMSAMVLDPERLLWVPGAKTISIPAPRQAVTWTWRTDTWIVEYAAKLHPDDRLPDDTGWVETGGMVARVHGRNFVRIRRMT